MRLDHFDQFDTNISMMYGEENHKVMSCVKVLLVLFNVLCLVTGILLIYSGMSVMVPYTYQSLCPQMDSLVGPSLLVLAGFLVVAVAFMGIVGVLKESVCMILSFSFILAVIFMFEISISLTGLVYQTEIRNMLSQSMSRAMKEYPRDPVSMHAVDTLQYQLSCCGAEGPADWKSILDLPGGDSGYSTSGKFDSKVIASDDGKVSTEFVSMTHNVSAVSVGGKIPEIFHSRVFSFPSGPETNDIKPINYPDSCCASWTGPECDQLQETGCLDRVDKIIRLSGRALLFIVMAVGTVQFLGILFACSLGKLIRRQKSERETLKWEFRNHILQTRSPTNFETFVREGQMENNKL